MMITLHAAEPLTGARRLARAIAATLVLSLAVACGGGDATSPGNGPPGNGPPGNGTPVVAAITITPADLQLQPGQSAPLSATATTSGGAPVAATFVWSSSNAAVASVSSTGLVTAIASGSTAVEARVGAVVGRSTLVVVDTAPVTLRITPSDTVTLGVGQTQALAATARSAGGAVVGAPIVWESDTPAVASVAASGVVTALTPGTALVRARSGSLSASLVVVVTPPAPNAPGNLASVVTRGEVALSWSDNSGGNAAFEVQRRALPDTLFTATGSTAAGVVRFVDTLDLAADTLVYRVRAVVPGAASSYAVDTVVAPIPPLHVTVDDVVDLVNTLLPSPALPADGRDLGAELAAIVPLLLAHPDVLTVLLHTETATAQVILQDGLSINIIHNKVPTAAEIAQGAAMRMAQAGAPRAAWSMTHRTGGVAAPSVPGSKTAGIVSIGGGAEVLPEIRRILSDGGYAVQSLDGSIEGMRGWKGFGAIYFDTHGTAWQTVKGVLVDPATGSRSLDWGASKYALQTSTEIAQSALARYLPELERGDLTISVAIVGTGAAARHVASFSITESFVAKHWAMDDAIMVLHSCFGGSGPFTGGICQGLCALWQGGGFDPTPIRNAILGSGVRVVQSYDNYVWPTTSLPSMAYFLDRLVGANVRAPMANPKRRPFDLALVRTSMAALDLLSHSRGLGNVPPRTTFAATAPDVEIIGAPSIREIDVIDDAASGTGRAELLGTFGGRQGSVTIGGSAVAVSSWTKTKITLNGPFTGPGATGDVIVEAPGGLESNEVPLTEWRGTLTLTLAFDQGDAKAVGEVDVKFRADVHERRKDVEEEPEARLVSTYISPASVGRVTGSGVLTTSATGRVLRLTGTKEMEILDKATVDAGGSFEPGLTDFGGVVTIDSNARTMEFCFSMNGVVTVRGEGGGEPTEDTELPALFVLPTLSDFQSGRMQCLRLPLNTSFGTTSGRRTARQDGVTATLEWTAFVSANPPRQDTKG